MQQQQSTHGQPPAKKSLGQHFLKREDICRRIAMLLLSKPDDMVLEIGPGPGALTRAIEEQPHHTPAPAITMTAVCNTPRVMQAARHENAPEAAAPPASGGVLAPSAPAHRWPARASPICRATRGPRHARATRLP